MTIGIQEQIKCVRRELAYRQKVYPRLVMQGKLDERQAKYQIDVMNAVLDTLLKTPDNDGLFSQPVNNGDSSAK